MALDRDAERVLEMVRLSGRPPYETLSAPEARGLFSAARDAVALEPAAVGSARARPAVGGDSAGGNLAAVVSLIARDRGAPKLRCQALLYPAVECGMTHASHKRFAEGYLLTRPTMKWFYEQY